MWVIRFLNGPQAGKSYPLKPGRNVLGRGTTCDIQVLSMGASKEHCEITVLSDKVTISDLKSRNGTVVNGVRIQNGFLKVGDRTVIHDVIFEMVPADTRPQVRGAPNFSGAAAPQYYPNPAAEPMVTTSQPNLIKGIAGQIQQYVERVALPGIYKLPEVADFKWVTAGFIGGLIFLVTLLCMIPAMQVTKVSILNEGKRRAQSLARSLAQLNQTALMQGSFSTVSTHSIESEDGVKQAFIIQQVDGIVVAPASLQGKIPDLSFVANARRETKSQVDMVDSSTIGASFPIGVYDPATGEPSVKYHAIIIYDVGSMAFDDGRVISLFMQALILSCVAGAILFFFFYKMIEFPITNLNQQLDTALREKSDNLTSKYQYPALQSLISNLNSLLSRYMQNDGSGAASGAMVSHADDAGKVVMVIAEACIVINNQSQIVSANTKFESLLHMGPGQGRGQPIASLNDASLQQNLEFLMSKSRENPFAVQSDHLEFGGINYQLNCQAFGQPVDYFVITMVEGGHG